MLTTLTKGGMLIYWLVFIYCLIKPFSDPAQMIIFWLGIVLLVVHLAEFIMHYKKLNQLNAGGANGFVQTMLFGFVYWLPIFKSNKTTSRSANKNNTLN